MRRLGLLFLLFSFHLLPAQEWVAFGFNASIRSETVVFEDGSYAQIATGNPSALVIRFNACGDTLWTRELFQNQSLNRVFGSQGVGKDLWITAGLGTNQDSAIALLKIDETGTVLISKSIRAPINFVWYRLNIDVDGNLYLSGNSTATTGLANTVLKLNPQGQEIHAYQYSDSFIWGLSVAAKNGGLLNITGRTIYKLDPNGNVEWIKRYQGYYQSSIPPISLDDGYLIFGKYIGAIDRTLVFKIDLQGNLVWASDVYLNINATAAVLGEDGHLRLLYTNFGPNTIQWAILELNANGQYVSTHLLPKNTGDFLYSRDIDILPGNELLISGLIDFTFASYQAQVFRKLPLDLNNLQNCPATLSSIPTETNNLIADPNVPSFGPDRYSGFNIQSFNFWQGYPNLNFNLFCASSDPPFLDLGPDLNLCPFEDYYLSPNFNNEDFQILWSTGETTDSIKVRREGWYWCEISNNCGSETVRDSVFISFYAQDELRTSFSPERPVLGDSITLQSTQVGFPITWTYGDTSATGNPINLKAEVSMSKGIVASFIDSNGCRVSDTLYPSFEEPRLFMPNAFTPNKDGLNDYFGPHPDAVFDFVLEIYDRYGKQQARLENTWWDGGDLPRGSYTYVIFYQIQLGGERRIKRGIVNLIR